MFDGVIDPAPANIHDVYSVEGIAADRESCETACQDVECCFSHDADSGEGLKFLACMDYSPYQNLRNDTKVATAPANLDGICSPSNTLTPEGNELCERFCSDTSCCLGTFPDVESCLQSYFISCVTYAACGGLAFPSMNSVVDPVPEDLDDYCKIDDLLLTDASTYDSCSDNCVAASCCGFFNESNCFADDPFGCSDYARCGLLALTGGDLERAPENIHVGMARADLAQDVSIKQATAVASWPYLF